MITVQVRSVLSIAKILGGRKITVTLPEGAALRDLLQTLADTREEFYDAVCSEDGYNESKAAVLVNGSSAAAIGGVGIRLCDGDDVLIMPVMSGG